MKKFALRIAVAAMAVLMLFSAVGCAVTDSAQSDLVRHDIEGGISISLPPDFEVVDPDGFHCVIAGEDVKVMVVRDPYENFVNMGLENLVDADLGLYAEIFGLYYEFSTVFAPDENGNYVATHRATEDGEMHFYYATLRKGSDSFWAIYFNCKDSDVDKYIDQFPVWNNTITVE